MKIIFILRNPVDRAYSNYWHQVRGGKEYLSFEAALKREQRRINKSRFHSFTYSYLEKGFYSVQINRFLNVFDRKQLYIVKFEIWSFNLVDIILMLLLIWLLVCNTYGARPENSFEAWMLFVRCFLIYLYFSRNIGTIISLKGLVIMLAVLLFLEGGLAFLQQMTHSNIGKINNYFGVKNKIIGLWEAKKIRASGTFITPNILAGWVMALLPMTLAWCVNEKKKVFKCLLLSVSLI